MHFEVKTWLFDIYKSIVEIEGFVEDINFEMFLNDVKTIKAVERNLEIMGEASNRIYKLDQSFAEKLGIFLK